MIRFVSFHSNLLSNEHTSLFITTTELCRMEAKTCWWAWPSDRSHILAL